MHFPNRYKYFHKLLLIALFASFIVFSGVIYGFIDYINKNKMPTDTVEQFNFKIKSCIGPYQQGPSSYYRLRCVSYSDEINISCINDYMIKGKEESYDWLQTYVKTNNTVLVDVYDKEHCASEQIDWECCCPTKKKVYKTLCCGDCGTCAPQFGYVVVCILILICAGLAWLISYAMFFNVCKSYVLCKN
jgi:hypothetical protein